MTTPTPDHDPITVERAARRDAAAWRRRTDREFSVVHSAWTEHACGPLEPLGTDVTAATDRIARLSRHGLQARVVSRVPGGVWLDHTGRTVDQVVREEWTCPSQGGGKPTRPLVDHDPLDDATFDDAVFNDAAPFEAVLVARSLRACGAPASIENTGGGVLVAVVETTGPDGTARVVATSQEGSALYTRTDWHHGGEPLANRWLTHPETADVTDYYVEAALSLLGP